MNPVNETISVVGSLFLVILLTVVFEEAHHKFLHRLEHHSKFVVPVIDQAFRQLAILGFASLLFFTIVRRGVAKELNDKFVGRDDVEIAAEHELLHHHEPLSLAPTPIANMFQNVHFLILSVMLIYSVVIAFIILGGHRTYIKWKQYDNETETNHSQESVRYHKVKRRFMKPSVPGLIREPIDTDLFMFPLYLGELLFSQLSKLVTLGVLSLSVVFVGFTILVYIMPMDVFDQQLFFMNALFLIAAISTAAPIALNMYINRLIARICDDNLASYDSTPLLSRVSYRYLLSSFVKRTNLSICNRQDLLLPLGQMTKSYIDLLIQIIFTTNILVFGVATEALCQSESAHLLAATFNVSRMVVCLVLAIPILSVGTCLLFIWPPLLSGLVLFNALEFSRDKSLVSKIEKAMRTKLLRKVDQMVKVSVAVIQETPGAMYSRSKLSSNSLSAHELKWVHDIIHCAGGVHQDTVSSIGLLVVLSKLEFIDDIPANGLAMLEGQDCIDRTEVENMFQAISDAKAFEVEIQDEVASVNDVIEYIFNHLLGGQLLGEVTSERIVKHTRDTAFHVDQREADYFIKAVLDGREGVAFGLSQFSDWFYSRGISTDPLNSNELGPKLETFQFTRMFTQR